MRIADFWQKENGAVRCKLCPHSCLIPNEGKGLCGVRKNYSNTLYTLVYGRPAALNIDPIEKKPLYHFLPGARALSLGTVGCNLFCQWCQNWEIARAQPTDQIIFFQPEDIISLAKDHNCQIIAYTYTEPTIFFEYMIDIAKLARRAKIKNVIVSNGYISNEPLKKLLRHLDGANIDLKFISDEKYKKWCGAKLEPILENLKLLSKKCWLEITNLLIPGLNDSDDEIKELTNWIIQNLGNDIPIHFTAYYPAYKFNVPPTPPETVKKARKLALSLNALFVYSGNILDNIGSNTSCPNCGKELIVREGFIIKQNLLNKGRCPNCRYYLPGVW